MPGICLFWHIHAEDFACLILAASYENDKSRIISGTILTLIMIIVRSIPKEEEGVGCRRGVWAVERGRMGCRKMEEGDTQTG